MELKLNENQKEAVIKALDYYMNQICAGDVEGTDAELSVIEDIISQVQRQ